MNGEFDDISRRKDDQRFAEFMGEFREWKEKSDNWKKTIDEKLAGIAAVTGRLSPEHIDEILEFMDSIRTPRRLALWAVRAFIVAAVGGVFTAVASFIRHHLRIN